MTLPEGTFIGTVLPPYTFLNRIWSGKVFTGNRVVNIIFGREMIEGRVEEGPLGMCVFIKYPQLHLTDVLYGYGPHWVGTMNILGMTVKFTLEKVPG